MTLTLVWEKSLLNVLRRLLSIYFIFHYTYAYLLYYFICLLYADLVPLQTGEDTMMRVTANTEDTQLLHSEIFFKTKLT